MPSDLHDRLTRAFGDLFAGNVPYFGGGGPGYYGVRLENVTPDGSEVDLVLTFRSGQQYCCFEAGCHFAYSDARAWAKLRECMDRHGLSGFPLPVIRKVRGVIEPGAVAVPSPQVPASAMEGSEYETGPAKPLNADGVERASG